MNGRDARRAWNRTPEVRRRELKQLREVMDRMDAAHDRLAANLAKKSRTDTAAALRDIAEFQRLSGEAEELINKPWGRGREGAYGCGPEEPQSQ